MPPPPPDVRGVRISCADPQPRPHQLALDERGHLGAEVGLAGAGNPGGAGSAHRRVCVAVAALVLLLHLVEGLGQVGPDAEIAAAVVVANVASPVAVLRRVVDGVMPVVEDGQVLGVAVSRDVLEMRKFRRKLFTEKFTPDSEFCANIELLWRFYSVMIYYSLG